MFKPAVLSEVEASRLRFQTVQRILLAAVLVLVVVAGMASLVITSRPPSESGTSQSSSFSTSSTESVANLTSDSLGYIGCSNTQGSVQGYHSVHNKGYFWPAYGTGGFGITAWAQPDTMAWTAFKQMVAKNGQPRAVWVELCEQARSPVNFTAVRTELDLLREFTTPTTVFYISPLNLYAPGIVCNATGPHGVNDTIGFVNEAVAEGLAKRGPVLGPLTASLLVSDMCHPNQAGQTLLGNQLTSFFG